MSEAIKLRLGGRKESYVLIDADDLEKVMKYKWWVIKPTNSVIKYARTQNEEGKAIRLHRYIIDALPGEIVDHINGDGLDNRRCNLRKCTHAENLWNSHKTRQGCKSIYKGVTKRINHDSYLGKLCFNGKVYYLGSFKNEVEAARAYNEKAKELFGEFARLNEIPDEPEKPQPKPLNVGKMDHLLPIWPKLHSLWKVNLNR